MALGLTQTSTLYGNPPKQSSTCKPPRSQTHSAKRITCQDIKKLAEINASHVEAAWGFPNKLCKQSCYFAQDFKQILTIPDSSSYLRCFSFKRDKVRILELFGSFHVTATNLRLAIHHSHDSHLTSNNQSNMGKS